MPTAAMNQCATRMARKLKMTTTTATAKRTIFASRLGKYVTKITSTPTDCGETIVGKANGETANFRGVIVASAGMAPCSPLEIIGFSTLRVMMTPAARISEPLLTPQELRVPSPTNTATTSAASDRNVAHNATMFRVGSSIFAVSAAKPGMRAIGPIIIKRSGNSLAAA